MTTRRAAIIGAGNVGATVAFTLINTGLVEELSLIDINSAKAEGEALDLQDGVSFLRPARIHWGGYEQCRGAQVIIITAGANQKPGQSRMELLEQNAAVFKQIVPAVLEYNDQAVIIVVTNPVDPLTYLAMDLANLRAGQVIGSGTVLDTARLRNQISLHCRIDPRNIHAYVIGGHGEGAVPVWSAAQIAGLRLEQFCRFCGKGCAARTAIDRRVFDAADRIIKLKGATFYSVSLAVARIVQSILADENSVLTVTTLVDDYYGINGVCLSLPAVLGHRGIKEVLPLELAADEIQSLQYAAGTLKEGQLRISRPGRLAPAPS
ncbi:MAG: L-lactate dehydrogenase [Bacillota bacterium]